MIDGHHEIWATSNIEEYIYQIRKGVIMGTEKKNTIIVVLIIMLVAIVAWAWYYSSDSWKNLKDEPLGYQWEAPETTAANQTVEYVWLFRWCPLEPWESIEELKAFLEQDDTDEVFDITAGEDGILNYRGINMCEHDALQLIDRAFAIGKTLHFLPLPRSEYLKWWTKWKSPWKRTPRANEYHAIVLAIIGNDVWYIEPDTDVHFKALKLD